MSYRENMLDSTQQLQCRYVQNLPVVVEVVSNKTSCISRIRFWRSYLLIVEPKVQNRIFDLSCRRLFYHQYRLQNGISVNQRTVHTRNWCYLR